MTKGKDLMIGIAGEVLGYATDCSIDVTTDTTEVTSTKYKHKTSAGNFKEYESDVNSISLSSSYVLSDSMEDYMTLVQTQLAGTAVDVTFSTVETEGPGQSGDITVSATGLKASGKALITSISLSAPVDGECTFQVSLQGTGAWTFEKK